MKRPAESRDRGILAILRAGDARVTVLVSALASVQRDANRLAVREQLIGCICDTVSSQRAAEEQIVYPAMVREHPKLVFALLLADQGLSMRIAELRNPAKDHFERELALVRLIGMIRLNMQEREQVLYPLIKREFSLTRVRPVRNDMHVA